MTEIQTRKVLDRYGEWLVQLHESGDCVFLADGCPLCKAEAKEQEEECTR